ncbi:hypothetical protein SteCoe_34760 [Stentor coeruleus]|uniref:Methyltransferase domain-containing protein n=1 Tax=Stentor coeruleus TaxID=5963 RepID=A0A1R2ATU8_9CILI|nr:hypothetical protein SteCoe_34760 [Stentor coeruleus]
MLPNYGNPEYWKKLYEEQQGKTYDWLEGYKTLKPIIKTLINPTSKILILGCGNAELSEEMYLDGFHNIENIDISEAVIQQMASRCHHMPEMKWKIMDVRDLEYPSNFFDIAIDKGTIDALLCGTNSYLSVARMTKEVQRVLKVGGVYMVVSLGVCDSKLEHLESKHLYWETYYPDIDEESDIVHDVYLCKKKEGADKVCEDNWHEIEAKFNR